MQWGILGQCKEKWCVICWKLFSGHCERYDVPVSSWMLQMYLCMNYSYSQLTMINLSRISRFNQALLKFWRLARNKQAANSVAIITMKLMGSMLRCFSRLLVVFVANRLKAGPGNVSVFYMPARTFTRKYKDCKNCAVLSHELPRRFTSDLFKKQYTRHIAVEQLSFTQHSCFPIHAKKRCSLERQTQTQKSSRYKYSLPSSWISVICLNWSKVELKINWKKYQTKINLLTNAKHSNRLG